MSPVKQGVDYARSSGPHSTLGQIVISSVRSWNNTRYLLVAQNQLSGNARRDLIFQWSESSTDNSLVRYRVALQTLYYHSTHGIGTTLF